MTDMDGLVAAVPKANRESVCKHAVVADVIFRLHRAIKRVECWCDEMPDRVQTSFPTALEIKDDEVVVFSWLVWPSKAARRGLGEGHGRPAHGAGRRAHALRREVHDFRRVRGEYRAVTSVSWKSAAGFGASNDTDFLESATSRE